MQHHWPSDEAVAKASSDKSSPATDSSTLFVRGLNYDLTPEQVKLYFEEVGPVKRAIVSRSKETGASLGYGFIEFAMKADADAAMERFHGTSWMDHKLQVTLAISKDMSKTGRDELKKKQMREDKTLKNRTNRLEKEKFKEELKEAGIEYKSVNAKAKEKLVVPPEVIAANTGTVLVISGFKEDTPADRIKASCKRIAFVAKFIYPAPESRPNVLAARVVYESAKDAKVACRRFNNKVLRDCNVKAYVLDASAALKAARLIIRNVDYNTTEQNLIDLFKPHGNLLDAHLPRSAEGNTRGIAFIQYADIKSASEAIEKMNGTELRKRVISVDWALSTNAYQLAQTHEKKQQEVQDKIDSDKKAEQEEKDDVMEDVEDEDMEEEDNEDDDAEEENEEDDDEDNDDEDNEDDKNVTLLSDAALDKEITESIKKRTNDVEEGCTLFIRNVSFETTEDILIQKFSEFGKVKLCKIVIDKELQRSMGTAFVQFYEKSDADQVLKMYGVENETDMKKLKEAKFKKSGKNDINVLRLDGRELIIVRAVNRNKAKELTESNSLKRQDKRNLYLAREGLILSDSEAAEDMSKEDMEKRTRGWTEKRDKLKNPNFFVSKVRLSVRNIPATLEEKDLKAMFLNDVKKNLKEAGQKHGGVAIRQAKIIRETEKFDAQGIGKSRGYGFVEFYEHEHALLALRLFNNNPTTFSKFRRPIVEFAVDDIRKMMVIDKIKEGVESKKSKVRGIQRQAEDEAIKALGGKINPDDLKQLFAQEAAKRRARSTFIRNDSKKQRRN